MASRTDTCTITRRQAVAGALGASLLAAPHLSRASTYPSGPVTMIVAFPAGAGTDIVSRVLAEKLASQWKQPVIVDNKGGGNGIIAAEVAAKAKPDGLTLFSTSAMTQAINPALYEKLPYRPLEDFAPITRTINVPFVLLVDNKSPITSVQQLTALLRAKPGRCNYGAGTLPSRVASELYKTIAEVDATYVGYKSNPQAFPDVQNGLISFMMVDTVNARIAIERGFLKGLLVTDTQRSPLLPSVPTAAEASMPDLVLTTWAGLFAPRATPAETIQKIYAGVEAAMADPTSGERLEALGGLRQAISPDGFGAFCRSEINRWEQLIRRANIKLE